MKSAPDLPSEKKLLLICRHAKSSWQDGYLSDRERPLNKRGECDAPDMGRRLLRRGIQPDLIMTSSAVRARMTAEHYALALGYPMASLQINPELYAISASGLVALLRTAEQQCATLMLVGHNPESTDLANALGNLVIDNIPTSGIVALEFAVVRWQDLQVGTGTLLFFDFPKNVL